MFTILEYNLSDTTYSINLEKSTNRLNHINSLIIKNQIKNLNRFYNLTHELTVYFCAKSYLIIFEKSLKNNLNLIFVSKDNFNVKDICYYPKDVIAFEKLLQNVYFDLEKTK